MGSTRYTKDNAISLSLALRARDAGDDDTVILDANGKLVCGMHSADGYRFQLNQVVRACNAYEELVAALKWYRDIFEHPKDFELDYMKNDCGTKAAQALAKVEAA